MARNSGLVWDNFFFTGTMAIGKGENLFADPSAWFEIGPDGTNKGLLIPRVISTTSIANPKEGLFVYDKSTKKIKYFDGVDWKESGIQTINGIGPDDEGNIDITAESLGAEQTINKGVANGYAPLGADSKLPPEYLPPLAITDYLGSVPSQTEMLLLQGQKGDWVTRSDLGTVWIISGNDPSQLSSWTQLTYPTSPVISVNGKTGAVVLAPADIGAAPDTGSLNYIWNQTATVQTGAGYNISGKAILAQNGTIESYNTSDQTTNFERIRQYWTGSVFYIRIEQSGTGVIRNLVLGNIGTNFSINNQAVGGVGYFDFNRGTSTASVSNITSTGTISTASGVNNCAAIINTINQTGSAGYRANWISIYEQALASGVKYLCDWGTNTAANGTGTHTSKFNVTNTGVVTCTNTICTANLAVAPTVVNGGLYYNTALNKEQIGIAGTWQNIATEAGAVVTGRKIYVDKDSPSSTDTRTGISKYSESIPFKTIQAAVSVVAAGDIVNVRPGAYTESISATGNLFIKFEDGASLTGASATLPIISATNNIIILGEGMDNSSYPNTITINGNTSGNAITTASGNVYCHGVNINNSGSGHTIASSIGFYIFNSRIVANTGIACNGHNYATGRVDNSYIKSSGNHAMGDVAAVTVMGMLIVTNSTVITLSSLAHHAMYLWNYGNYYVDNCKIYSANGGGAVGGQWANSTTLFGAIFRNNMFNTFLESIYVSWNASTNPVYETDITNCIANVRDVSKTNAFLIVGGGAASAISPTIINNTYNKASFSVAVNGLTNVTSNNIPSVPFPASYPVIL